MKLKSFSLITLASGILLLLVGIVLPLIALYNYTPSGGAFGIIGGADAPTYRFVVLNVMNGWPLCVGLFGAALVVTAMFCLLFSKTVKTNCTCKTSLVSLGLSAVGAMGINCALIWYFIAVFHEMSKHPIEYPASICLGLVCLLTFFALIALYFVFRIKHWSLIGFVIDVLTSIMYLPPFLVTCLFLSDLIC